MRPPLAAFLASRAIVAVAAMFAVVSFTPGPNVGESGRLHPFGGWPGGGLLDWVFASLARWDAGHYMAIAADGYDTGPDGGPTPRAAFFPLYPLLVRVVATPFGASDGALLIAGVVVALGAFLASLVVLHRLVALELGERVATLSVWLLALYPGALYFSAPYSESVFLLTTVSAFYAARRGRWAWAGIAAALATAARPVGLAVIVPLAIMYVAQRPAGSPRLAVRRDVLWLALVPLGLIAFSLHLAAVTGDALAWSNVQGLAFQRVNDLPPLTAWHALTDAWHGLQQLDASLGGHRPTGAALSFDNALSAVALLEVAVLAFVLVATIGAFRRLPLAYGAYAAAVLAIVLSSRLDGPGLLALQPMHRYAAVIFPLFVWLAVVCDRRGWELPVVAVWSGGLALLTAVFATGHWLV